VRAPTLCDLRHHAITSSLFPATTLGRAMGKLGFVQADPIRSPARAQDLILRHRVRGYRAGDLDRSYRTLKLEEDYLYAYGFMPVKTWQLLHPRGRRPLTREEQKVLDIVSNQKRLHPRELEKHLGKRREVNAWGGYSKSTTRSLEKLHYLGMLRIAGRDNGIRIYERAAITHEPMDPDERLRRLVLLLASILTPLPHPTWAEEEARFPRSCGRELWRAPPRTGSVMYGQKAACTAARRRMMFASWRHSIRWFGIGGASSIFGDGPIASKHIHRPRSASWGTMPFPCCGEQT